MDREYVFAAATLLVCLAISGISLCRLRLTDIAIRRGVRIKYSVLGSGALVFGFAPWTGEWPGWTGLVFSFAVLVGLLSSSARWRHRAPPETRSDYSPLSKDLP
ncbi:hypothetical protein [Variovorax atrisoli]|uniref:hypothetical protein n=1 Tax=Variovorax atrisoli TaxID=3394203 RepID=UPI00037636A7|nr:hypothetical protein [Variovorax paradoxus]